MVFRYVGQGLRVGTRWVCLLVTSFKLTNSCKNCPSKDCKHACDLIHDLLQAWKKYAEIAVTRSLHDFNVMQLQLEKSQQGYHVVILAVFTTSAAQIRSS
jgi:hypothetical protein